MLKHKDITIHWLGHDGFLIQHHEKNIYIDPFKIKSTLLADLVLVTHEHFDHLSPDDLKKIASGKTPIVCAQQSVPALESIGTPHPMAVGQHAHLEGVNITAVPAYNINKYRDPATKAVFHPKEDGKVGFIIEIEGTKIYHAGDSDHIPEMKTIKCDIALLPVSGTYVMTAEEAAAAAKEIKPHIVIPMHYGSIVGKEDDARHFAKLLEGSGMKVEILKAE
jgi:L-ascorbate metabolism protein UlaG (beta-lactamase superfamily)